MSDEIDDNSVDWSTIYGLLISWELLTAGEVSTWLGIDRRKILFYVENGIVEPADASPGSGRRRKFTLADLVLFMLFDKLGRMGIAPRCLRSIAADVGKIVRSQAKDVEERPYLVIKSSAEGKDTLMVTALKGDQLIGELIEPSVSVFVHLAGLQSEALSIFMSRADASEARVFDLLRLLGEEGKRSRREALVLALSLKPSD